MNPINHTTHGPDTFIAPTEPSEIARDLMIEGLRRELAAAHGQVDRLKKKLRTLAVTVENLTEIIQDYREGKL